MSRMPNEPENNHGAQVRDVKRFHLVLFQTGRKTDPFGDFNHRVFQRVQDILDEHLTAPPNETEIDVWLDSPGGSASTAYKLFLELSTRCKIIRIVVPDYAKSAATLLALGGDEIFMAAAAELGPLDAQIGHPDREGVTISAIDSANALGFLSQFGADCTVTGGFQVLDSTQLPRIDVLREFSAFTAKLLNPVMSKLDPHLIHQAKQELELAKQYAMRILGSRRVAQGLSPHSAKAIAEHLVNDYPAHEFIISRDEARRLSLPVIDADKYDNWAAAKNLHNAFRQQMFTNQRAPSMIQPWTEPPAEKAQVPPLGPQGESDAVQPTAPEGNNERADSGSSAN
jgi:Serine dehydrogenase proteinase